MLVLLLASSAAASADVAVVEKPLRLDDPMPAPVVYWGEVRTEPHPVRLHFLLADLASPEIEAAVAVTADPDGDGAATATLRDPLEFAAEENFIAAVNASAFMHLLDAAEAEKKRGWYKGKHVRLFGLAIDDNARRNPPHAARIPIWFDPGGRAHVGATEGARPAHAAADWEGAILTNGVVAAVASPALMPRTLAGTNTRGDRLLLVVIEGRQKNYSEGMTLGECGRLMLAKGCSSAVNFDGGGSSVMLANTNGTLRAVGNPPGRWLRPLPVLLGIRRCGG